MIADLKPYPAYKDSGVEWLGQVPAHWEVRRMKSSVCERCEKGFPDEPLLAATQTKGVVCKDRYENRTVLAINNLHLLKLVHVGDFVISLRSFQGGIEYAREQGIISPAYTIFYPIRQEIHAFLTWLFKSQPYIENLSLFVTGIRQGQNIDYEKLSRSSLSLPPLPEQSAIVCYLNCMDRRIRLYIRAQEKLIKLLEEQKQAIIHQAVTRGLDPNVRLKPSGVEWIGEIPEHWTVRQIKWCASINPSKREAHEFLKPETPVTFLPMERIGTDGKIDTREILNAHNIWNGFTYFRRGDILVAKITPCFENGKGACLTSLPTEIGFGSTEFHVLRAKSSILPQFLYRLTLAKKFRQLGADAMTGAAGQQRVPQIFIANYSIPVPPILEQSAIVHYLDKKTEDIALLLSSTRKKISLLREYRTRLIADVVTGKLDVREIAARLPEEAEEIEESEISDSEELPENEGSVPDLDFHN